MGSIIKLETYAKENNIPIIRKDGLEFIIDYIKKYNIKNILEIGTAIGYSAINMAQTNEDIKVTTIERNENMYAIARKNIRKFGLEKRITLILNNALNVNVTGKYDLIFIDAAPCSSKNQLCLYF